MLALLLELAVYGLLAYGVVHCFGLEVDWEQHVIRSRTSEYRLGAQRLEAAASLLTPASFCSLHLPPVLPVAEDGDPPHHVAGRGLSGLGAADRPLEVCGAGGWVQPCRAGLTAVLFSAPRWVQVRGSLQKLCAAVPLSVLGTATVALFLISLVGSPLEPGVGGRREREGHC